MAPWYLTVFAMALICNLVLKAPRPRLSDARATEVILGGRNGSDGSLPPVFAHRGGGREAPENTLAGIREAKRCNASGVHLDLSFTSDEVGVLLHDDSLERTTNGAGKLTSTTFEHLRQLDAASKHPLAKCYRGERVPTIDEAVQECLRLGLRLIIHVKELGPRSAVRLNRLFYENPSLYHLALVASPSPELIYGLRLRNPNIVTALTWRPGFYAYSDEENLKARFESPVKHWIAQALDWIADSAFHCGFTSYATGVSAVLVNKDSLSADYVRAWRDRGIHVIAWTSSSSKQNDFLRKVLRVPIITDALRQA
ncbi:hypothetical protein V5799_027769 [Amblyomma americanum]|uniref:GP-PDE domain-containing protein n=1 Tax=Amblyomma americanum TaxID=6943 RepID=A0AAQ4DES5_AMBAM